MKSIFVFLVIAFLGVSSYALTVNSNEASYNLTWSKILNTYSAITHCDAAQISSWSCRICKKVQKPESISNIQITVTNITLFTGYLRSQNKIILSFRGTTNIINWIQDFSYLFVDYPRCKDCKVHAGFYETFQSLKLSNFYSIIQNLLVKYPKAGIIMTGSSLGAALATVAAVQVQLIIGGVVQLHIFGSPRVGNANFANFVRLKVPKINRVIHNADIVPHVPLTSQNYHHVPYQVLFDQEMNNYRICDDSGQDPKCSNSFAPDYSISDHITYWQKPIIENVCNDTLEE